MNDVRFIMALRELREKYAQVALGKPQGRDAFEYGHVTGIYAGMTMALATIDNLLKEEDDKEHGQSRRGNQ